MKNKIFLALLTSLYGFTSFASSIKCIALANQSDVVNVFFNSTFDNYFASMLVLNKSGSTDLFNANSNLDPISASSSEELKSAIFSKAQGIGFASIQYKFFTRTEDENQNGWSQKNGVKMIIILPPSVEQIKLNCVRKI